MTAKYRIFSLVAGFALLSACPLMFAQTGSVAGILQDASGGVLPGANVTVVRDGTGLTRNTVTDSAGVYNFPLLPVGTYTITAEAPGFRKYERKGFTINLDQHASLDLVLVVGDVKDTVSVTAESPLLNTRTSEVSALIDPQRMTELPLNGRNPIQLAGLLPGVGSVQAPEYALDTVNGGQQISVSGSRRNHNFLLFDGSLHTYHFRNLGAMYASPDTMQEFQVITNLFSAEYGSSGGAVLNAVTRSGSNEFHGNFYEFLRNAKLNARSFFLPRKSNLKQNQFGLTNGGPILRNKLFYFGSAEFSRIRPEASTVTAYPPTAAERSGDFSASTTPIRDPLNNNLPFFNNQIPLDRFDAVAKNVLNQYLLLPNQPDGRYISQLASKTNIYQFTAKLDYQINSKHTLSNRFFRIMTTLADPIGASNLPNYGPGERRLEVPANNVFAWTAVFSSNTVNQFRTSLFYSDNPIVNSNRQTLSDLGANFPVKNDLKFPPWLSATGRFQLRPLEEQTRREEQYEVYDNLFWQKTNHSLKFGARWHRGWSGFRGTYARENFTFDKSITGNALADFFLGRPATMGLLYPGYYRDTLGDQFGFYFQDDWRITSNVTLNFGVRYEIQLPWIEERDWWSTLYKNSGFQSKRFPAAPIDMAYVGDPGVPQGLIDRDLNNFEPRFGFAYTPGWLRKTVIRGGFGVFSELVNADIVQNTGQPFQFNQTFYAIEQLSDPLKGLGRLPLPPDVNNPYFRAPFSLYYPNADTRNGYIYHYNLLIQRELRNNLSVEVGYVGKQSRKLSRAVEVNPAIYVAGASTLKNIESRRAYKPGLYSSLTESSTSANQNYNSLQAQVVRRFADGFTFQSSYTFSKSIDDSSAYVLGGPLPNPFDWHSQRGLSDFDQRHNFNLSFVAELPRMGTSVIHKVFVHGWEFSGLFNARSGNPFTVLSGRDVALSGTGNQTADVVGDPTREHANKGDAVQQWFDKAAFRLPQTGSFGNSARNNVRGPGRWNLDTGIFRNFPIRESLRLQFRSEFFNMFNHANLGNPTSNMNNASFGKILSGDSPRVIQFALKLFY